MGYQAESAPWRNFYLCGAKELREGSPDWGRVPTRDMSQAMEAEHLFDILGVRFDPAAFDREPATINLHLTDLGEDHVLGIGRSAIHHRPGVTDPDAVVSMRLDRQTLIRAFDDATALEGAEIDGDAELVTDLFANLTVFTTQALIEP